MKELKCSNNIYPCLLVPQALGACSCRRVGWAELMEPPCPGEWPAPSGPGNMQAEIQSPDYTAKSQDYVAKVKVYAAKSHL